MSIRYSIVLLLGTHTHKKKKKYSCELTTLHVGRSEAIHLAVNLSKVMMVDGDVFGCKWLVV